MGKTGSVDEMPMWRTLKRLGITTPRGLFISLVFWGCCALLVYYTYAQVSWLSRSNTLEKHFSALHSAKQLDPKLVLSILQKKGKSMFGKYSNIRSEEAVARIKPLLSKALLFRENGTKLDLNGITDLGQTWKKLMDQLHKLNLQS